jgi:hypothetical protein
LNKWIKLVTIIFGIAILGILSYHLYMNSYVPYVPFTFSDQYGLIEEPKLNTAAHQLNMKAIFENHKVKCKMKDGKLMIQRKMTIGFENKELIYNYEVKANGGEIIQTH